MSLSQVNDSDLVFVKIRVAFWACEVSLLVLRLAFTRNELSRHHQLLIINYVPTEVPSPGVAAFLGFAASAKFVQFESAGVSTLYNPSFLT